MPNVDPIYQAQQQQFFYGQGLATAKKAQKTKNVRTWVPVVIVCSGLVLALLLLLFFTGAFFPHEKIYVNGTAYRLDSDSYGMSDSIPESYVYLGKLAYSEDPENSTEPLVTNWTKMPMRVYQDPANTRRIYLVWDTLAYRARR